jgi:RecB family exonuclease
MQSFLNLVAQKIVQKHENELGDIAIVLPNRRANIFLRQEFSKLITKSTWSPELFSLEDFVEKLVDLINIDQVDLMFELYHIHKKIEGANAEPFDEFMNWGTILLYDFNEIDRYLIDSKELYGFLSEARAIETWNPESGTLSEFQKKYLKFWDKLIIYYIEFRKHLLSQNKSYQGLSFRIAAENIKEGIKKYNYKKIYFSGFNALTEAEKRILEYFVKQHDAELFFDADNYYYNNKNQEAGKFLRTQINSSNNHYWVKDYFKENKKEINIYGISGNIGQAKLLGELIEANHQDFEIEKTAVVLADENILLPVLDSLPKGIDKVNITMGFGLGNSIFYDFFEKYLLLFQSSDLNEEIDRKGKYYYKESIAFFKHPVWNLLNIEIQLELKSIIDEAENEKKLFLDYSDFIQLDTLLDVPLLSIKEYNTKELTQTARDFCEKFRFLSNSELKPFNAELLFNFYNVFNRIIDLSNRYKEGFSHKAFIQLFRQVISSFEVSFIGEPLSGLQIMGVLETRTLDFEHIIMTSVNEGVLPSGKSQNTFIPYDIKRKFGLPSYKEKDAIFAYHFYRLLQRAKKISLIYNTQNDKLSGGEKSRFILQLQSEIEKYNPLIKVNTQLISEPPKPSIHEVVEIENNKKVKEVFINRLQKGISASALNSFMMCPLNFYYKYYLGLKTEDKTTDAVELNTFGNIVHKALELLYEPFIDKILDKKSISELKSNAEHTTRKAFIEIVNSEPNAGQFKLAFEVSKIYVKKIVALDEKEVKNGNEIIIKSLENEFKKRISIDHPIGYITIKGVIDRIDSYNGKKRIIDYKTGPVENRELEIKSIDYLIDGKSPKAFQMLLYYLAESEPNLNLDAGILSIKNKNTEFIPLKINLKLEIQDPSEIAKNILEEQVNRILNPALLFVHDKQSKYCDFCK